MQLDKFLEAMDKHGVAYITYNSDSPTAKRKTTFLVGTIDFDNDAHIARIEKQNIKDHGSPRPELLDDEVLVFSYSKDKFRKLKLSDIVRVVPLAAELRRATKIVS